jgi:hypothetical protein
VDSNIIKNYTAKKILFPECDKEDTIEHLSNRIPGHMIQLKQDVERELAKYEGLNEYEVKMNI